MSCKRAICLFVAQKLNEKNFFMLHGRKSVEMSLNRRSAKREEKRKIGAQLGDIGPTNKQTRAKSGRDTIRPADCVQTESKKLMPTRAIVA